MRLCYNINDVDKKFVVYRIINIINNKCYIGQTNNIKRRVRKHKNDSRIYNTILYRSIRKYGIDSFRVDVLCICDDKQELDEMEFHYIRQYKSRQFEVGYNLTDGGEGTNGYITTDEHKENISKALKGVVHSNEHNKKISTTKKENYVKENHPNFGKHLPEEVRKSISDGKKGKHISEETKKKISDYNMYVKDRAQYIIIEPNGNIITTSYVVDYCKDNGLVYSCMMKVSRGERIHHKQYRMKRL